MKQLYIIALLLTGLHSFAQDLPPNTQQQLENLADAGEEENQEDDELLQQFDFFRKHPLNLNTVTAEELQGLKFLTDLQIQNFIRYRDLLGKLIAIYELQSVPSWDLVTVKKLLPYVTVGPAVSLKENFLSRFRGDQAVLFRLSRVLEKSEGYEPSTANRYLGDRNHVLFRYRYQYKDLLYFGLVADKDAGEQFFKGAQSAGFDFYSFHFFARRLRSIKALAIGSYAVNLGQGLIQWQSLGFGKSSDIMSIKRQAPILLPYRSAGEFYFNQGAAITLQKKKWEATAFFSAKKISGNTVVDPVETFTGFLTSGYNRNATEIADRNKITLSSLGGNLSYAASSFKAGINAVAHHFSIPLQKRDEPYNLYAPGGQDFLNASVDFSYTYKNVHVFGEAAVDKNLDRAFINGAMISVDPKIDLSLLYRAIQKEYQSLFGNAFTENTAVTNEKGIYTGIAIRPLAGWQVNAYADFFQFPWLRYRVNGPTHGYDFLVQLNYQPNKQFGMYVRYKNKDKPIDGQANGAINYPEDQVRQNLRIHLSRQLSPPLVFRSRVEMLWFDRKATEAAQGFLGFAEAIYEWKGIGSNMRLQYFETGNYDSRVYAYEGDVMYSFSIPAFYDQGWRYYITLHYEVGRRLELWMRWAQSIFGGKEGIGSGLDTIQGQTRSEAKIQMQFSF